MANSAVEFSKTSWACFDVNQIRIAGKDALQEPLASSVAVAIRLDSALIVIALAPRFQLEFHAGTTWNVRDIYTAVRIRQRKHWPLKNLDLYLALDLVGFSHHQRAASG